MGAEGVRRVSADLSGKRTEQTAGGTLSPRPAFCKAGPFLGPAFLLDRSKRQISDGEGPLHSWDEQSSFCKIRYAHAHAWARCAYMAGESLHTFTVKAGR